MGCDEYKAVLIQRLYGEPVEAAGFDDHLASCEACRADLDEFDEIVGVYREVSTEPMPLRLRARVRAPRSRHYWFEAAAAGCFAAALVIGFVLWFAPAATVEIPWDAVDFASLEVVLPVSEGERAYLLSFLGAAPAWDRVSFAAEKVEWVRNRMDDLEAGSIW